MAEVIGGVTSDGEAFGSEADDSDSDDGGGGGGSTSSGGSVEDDISIFTPAGGFDEETKETGSSQTTTTNPFLSDKEIAEDVAQETSDTTTDTGGGGGGSGGFGQTGGTGTSKDLSDTSTKKQTGGKPGTDRKKGFDETKKKDRLQKEQETRFQDPLTNPFQKAPGQDNQLPETEEEVEQVQRFRDENIGVKFASPETSQALQTRSQNIETKEQAEQTREEIAGTPEGSIFKTGSGDIITRSEALEQAKEAEKNVEQAMEENQELISERAEQLEQQRQREERIEEARENRNIRETLLFGGQEIAQTGREVSQQVSEGIEKGAELGLDFARSNEIGDKEAREQAEEAITGISDLVSRETDLTRDVATAEQLGENILQGETARGTAEDVISTQIIGSQRSRELGEKSLEGAATLGTQLTGTLVSGVGAIGITAEEDIRNIQGEETSTPGTVEALKQGFPKVAGEVTEDPTGFAFEEAGEEVGETVVAASVAGPLGVGASLAPTPDVTVTPDTSGPTLGTVSTESEPSIRSLEGEFQRIENEQVPDLGDPLGTSNQRTENIIVEGRETTTITGKQGREIGTVERRTGERETIVPETRGRREPLGELEEGLTQQEAEVLLGEEPGFQDVREATETGGVEEIFTPEKRVFSGADVEPSETGVSLSDLGGSRKGGLRLPSSEQEIVDPFTVQKEPDAPDFVDPELATRDTDTTDINTVGDRPQTDPDTTTEPTIELDQDTGPVLDPTLKPDEIVGQTGRQKQGQGQQPETVFGQEIREDTIPETDLIPGSGTEEPRPEPKPEPEIFPEPSVTPRGRPDTTPGSVFPSPELERPKETGREETGVPGFGVETEQDFAPDIVSVAEGRTGEVDQSQTFTGLEARPVSPESDFALFEPEESDRKDENILEDFF